MFAKIKKYIAVVLVAVCMFSFVFTAFHAGGGDEITLAFWGTNKPYENALKKIAEEYNRMQSDFKVVIKNQSADNYRTWMGSRLAGGNAPEILATTNVYANADANNGYLYDLSEYLQEEIRTAIRAKVGQTTLREPISRKLLTPLILPSFIAFPQAPCRYASS